MDEPTNHLDIRSKDILKKALIDYEGTVVMVSHDRDFMKGICNRLFEFRDGHVKEHLCDIEEFMQLRKVERLNELDLDKSGVKAAPPKEVAKPAKPIANDAEQKQIRSQIRKAEEAIEQVEKEIAEYDAQLADPAKYEGLMNDKKFFDTYNKQKKQLETEMARWEELSTKLL